MKALRLSLAATLLLAACQSVPPAPSGSMPEKKTAEPYRNVYTQDRDSAPRAQRTIDYHSIPDAVPQDEPRGKYGNKSPYTVLGKTYAVLAAAGGYREEGTASWYGEKFQGFRTSSQEPYDMYAMSAAHKTLPIPSYVRVTNLDNNRSVVVRVNDRGPFHEGRIIDLSWAAAQKLGYANTGTARVRVETVTAGDVAAPPSTPAVDPQDGFVVQLGAFTQSGSARDLADRARSAVAENVEVNAGDDGLFRVWLGPYGERAQAERGRDRLRAAGLGAGLVLAVRPAR